MMFSVSDLFGMLLVLLLTVGALVLMTTEVFLRRDQPDRRYQPWLTAAFAAAALWASFAQASAPSAQLFGGAAVSDPFAGVVSIIVCGSLLLSSLIASGYLEALK